MKGICEKIVWTVRCLLVAGAVTSTLTAQDTQYGPEQQIPPPACLTFRAAYEGGGAPCTALTHGQWLADVTHWRMERRIRIGYDASRYEVPSFKWAQSAFMQPQMIVHDRYFYDAAANAYTVDRYLDDLTKRYGGIDAVLIWATYPNMGIDDRNQLDMVLDAERGGRRSQDGGGLPSARSARAVPHDDVGPGNA